MKKLLALCAAAVLAAAAPASALEWTQLGPRALGMGGAGVALPQGPIASYWNPAALGRATENAYGFQVPVTVHAGFTGNVVAGAKDFKNLTDACRANPLDPQCTQANLNAALSELGQPGNGLRADGAAGGDFKVGKIAFFANGFLAAGAVPKVDQTNTNITTPSSPQFISNNQSALIVKGARILEFGAGYGHELPFAPGVYLGGNLKLLRTQVGYVDYLVVNNKNDPGSIVSNLKKGAKSSGGFGVDLGALWDVHRTFDSVPLHPRFGLVGRNLNNPKFSQPDAAVADGVTGKFAVNPQVRMGASISPFHWWNIATDLDLTRNLTPVDNVASRQWGLGTEVNVFNRTWINVPLRFGLSRNLAESGSGTMLSAGAGLNFLHFMVDASATASPKRIDTQTQGKSTRIPRELGAAVQLSLLFGGSEDESPRAAPSSSSDVQPMSEQKVEEVRKNAEKAQRDLDKEAVKPSAQ